MKCERVIQVDEPKLLTASEVCYGPNGLYEIVDAGFAWYCGEVVFKTSGDTIINLTNGGGSLSHESVIQAGMTFIHIDDVICLSNA